MEGTALITGAAKRIGRAIALSLADKGHDIALHFRNSREEAEDVARRIRQKGSRCELFRADLADSRDTIGLVPRVFERFPDCRILINSASIFERARMMDTDECLFDRHLNINFKAPFFLSKCFCEHCTEGVIINMLDTKISRTLVEYFIYTLSKKTLAEFTLMAAKALGPGIRVNGVCPGLILPSAGMRGEDFRKMGRKLPLNMTGSPDDVVSAVDFFIANAFVTGEILYVDGGEHLQ